MFWSVLIPHLTVSAVFIGLLFRAVRRFERRADAIIAELDQADAESERKFNALRDEIRMSMRLQVDRAIAKSLATMTPQPAAGDAPTLQFIDTARSALAAVLPSEAEIELLPRWARVAFAARCARRVLPLAKYHWRGTPELLAVDNAVRIAELSAAVAEVHITAAAAAAARNAANPAAPHARLTAAATVAAFPTSGKWSGLGAIDAAFSAAHAAEATADATTGYAIVTGVTAFYTANTTGAVVYAANAAVRATDSVSATARAVSTSVIRRDFETVHGFALANGWTDDTPVPPSVFGPLWPDGPPEGWPKPEKPTTEIVISFPIPDDMTTADAVAFVKELAAALCTLDLAGSGHGIAIQPPLEITAPAPVPVGSSR